MTVFGRTAHAADQASLVGGSRPVMLVTFDVPVDPKAAEFAVDAAVESGQPLLVVNVVEMPFRPMTSSWGAEIVVMEDVDGSLRAPAELAQALAVTVERIRLVSPRPLAALLELVGERLPGLIVIGPDPGRVNKRRFARAERRIRKAAPCLVWTCSKVELG
jgi:nucleotide-binding universal stress UspA family protein